MQPVTMDAVAMSTRDSRQAETETQWYEPGRPGRAFFGVLGRPRTYLGFVYTLAVAFALGVTWFTVLVSLIAVGTSLTITLVGIPILIVTIYAWGWMAEVERAASNGLLGTSIPPIRYNAPSRPGWWPSFKARLTSTVTWRSLVFLLIVRFVHGTVVFSLAVTLISIPLGFLTAPLLAEVGTGVDIVFWRIENWYTGLIFAIAGIPLLVLAAHANNGLAWLSARLTEAFLTTSEPVPAVAPAAPAAPSPAPATTPAFANQAASTVPPEAPSSTAPVPPATSSPSTTASGPRPLASRTNEIVGQLKEATRDIGDQAKSAWSDFEQRTSAAVKAWNQPGATPESPDSTVESAPTASPTDDPGAAADVAATTMEAREFASEPEATAAPPAIEPTAPTPTSTSTSGGDEPPPDATDEESAAVERLPVVEVDVVARIVRIDGKELEVTRREFDLLALFAANPGRAFSREELLDRIWKNEYDITDRTIDTHVQRLRKKLGAAAESIQTVWGVGYRFAPPSAAL